MITLERLRYFQAVATSEHVGLAARAMHISPSVISSAIADLEREFGCSLFERQSRRLKLNPQGLKLLEKSRQLLGEVDALKKNLGNHSPELGGHIRIGASHFLMSEYLSSQVAKLGSQHPGLSLECVSLDTGLAIAQVLSGQLDLALAFSPFTHQDLDETILMEGEFVLATRKSHPLSTQKKFELSRLSEFPAVTFRASSGPNICEDHPMFRKFGIRPRHKYFYDNDFIARDLLLKSDGWALLPENVFKKFQSQLFRVPLPRDWSAPMRVSLICNRRWKNQSTVEKIKTIISGLFLS